ncbi:uncharacterized protein DNG_05075 [Cephalotrichum gorgonifer]|uniref:SPRY domain-containing protein n=1 Tax=Cephalotrichum gorgonifer TaxID=2041049 RepID=A0AAE8SVY3_9PEZI|nr:uncharacterized protein DNG_05075 [Cephalotrichum gorgonifer]
MCFGSSEKDGEAVGPRPAQGGGVGSSDKVAHSQQQQYAAPAGSPPPQQQYAAPPGPPPSQQYAPPSSPPPQQYSPPAGPPPSQQYAPPSGPPPRQEYAPPSGTPPSQQYAPPSGPPPSQHYAAPSGPPPSQQYAPPSSPPPQQYSPPTGPPPSQQYAPPSGPPPRQEYAPPPGPPPSSQQNSPPSGPPPSQQYAAPPSPPPAREEYAPPPGPPPAQQQNQYAPPPGPPSYAQDYAPPPSPPPPQQDPASKSKHDWEIAVPDTSLFPPPPAFFTGWDRSPSSNATEEEAKRGTKWCQDNPLTPPMTLDALALSALQTHDIKLMKPWGFTGQLRHTGQGVWDLQTNKTSPDSCVIGYPPLYAVTLHSPLASGKKKTIYYEVHVRDDGGRGETTVALGFVALPYPNFRLPGWQRGSMGVHGDDGHRFVNDMWGGLSFTQPFKRGETYGIGMTFEPVDGKIEVECFFTRGGKLDGKWDLHEEQDADVELAVTGLEGFHDLSSAVGTYKGTSLEVVFDPARWKYRP